MKLTVLNENTVYRKEYKGEHGLSLLVECSGRHILFDAGQTDNYLHNAKVLKADLSAIDAIVLSHGHYDHTGGIPFFHNKKAVPIYMQKAALRRKVSYQKDTDSYYFNGIPWLENLPKELHLLEDACTEILPGMHLISHISYRTDFEKPNPKFFLATEDGYVQDDMSDEQILVVEDADKIHIFAGCSHPGIINCIYEAKHYFPDKKIGCIAAGMHLIDAGEMRRKKTMEALEKEEFDMLIPMHCTGMHDIIKLKEKFGEKCKILSTGDSYVSDAF
ncbi:MAG: MBL fold metallo-hydrolase [Lachnospiraceae bacterium]|nr:MBL fold metallo-hydrolase [Lachnospiraceae bacterium]